MQGNY